MFCPKCGTKALDGAGFCQKCGTKLIADASAQSATPNPVSPTQPAGKPSAAVPKKKKPKKLLIILGAVFALIVILIAVNAGNLAKRGEQAAKDEEYINSQQQSSEAKTDSEVKTDVDDTAGKLLCKSVPVDTIMDMTAEGIIAAFGEPDIHEPDVYYDTDRIEYVSDQLCFIMSEDGSVFCLDAPAEKFTLNGQSLNLYFDDLVGILGDDYYSLGEAGYQWSIGDLSYTFYISTDDYIADIIEVSKIDTDEPVNNDAYLGDEGNDGGYANLDPALVGRWRSYDGGTLEFDGSGVISSCDFKCWSMSAGKPERICWEAFNGRVTCSAYFDQNITYEISELPDGGERAIITFPDSNNWSLGYQRTSGSTGDGIVGTWTSASNSRWSYRFNEDGTGMESEKYPLTWTADTTDDGAGALSYTLLDSTYFDYTVEGDSLVVFLSDSSRIYTRVGN